MKYFNLNPSKIFVKGYSRSVIIDIRFNEYTFVPNSLVDFGNYINKKNIDNIYKEFEQEVLDNYLKYLLDKKVIIISSNQNITSINLDYINSCKYLENAVVELNPDIEVSKNLLKVLHEINVKAIEIRLFFKSDFNYLFEILYKCKIDVINIILNYTQKSKKELKEIFNINNKINKLVFINANKNDYVQIGEVVKKNVIYTKQKNIKDSCGTIYPLYFAVNINHLLESQCHNTCLNRKISIDANGYIKNCPSMQQSYGNIKETKLIDVVRKHEFRKWWYYKKDDIDVCQDCEFRYMCSDCRAFIKDPNNVLSQPAKCGYNPYIAKWQGQEGWISVEQWRKENPGWEEKAKANRATYKKENCEENLKEEKEYFNKL